MKGAVKNFSKLVMVVDEKFVRLDGFPSDPLNAKRVINTSILCEDILEAKNFNFYPEDIESTKKAFPKGRLFNYTLEVIYGREPKET